MIEERIMCTVTMTQFKQEFGKYSKLSQSEDILVLKNGKPYYRIVSVNSPNSWETFFDKYEGSMREEEVDLSDPIAAGIIGKL